MPSRRSVLRAAIGSAVAAFVSACTSRAKLRTTVTATTSVSASPSPARSTPSCVLRPELAEGPFFVDEELHRSDIRVDPTDGSTREGTALVLTLNVLRVAGSSCVPVRGARVDVWHCDALGVYSDVAQQDSAGKKFLRGYQLTNRDGAVTFTTVYPGWYRGRAIHIHFKIRSESLEYTSQLFFDDSVNEAVHRNSPYSRNTTPNMRNADDGIFASAGSRLLVRVVRSGSGYAGTFDVGVTT